MGHICDVGKKSDRDAMLQKIKDKHGGRLDVLVPNVACLTHAGL
jgi:short-subunit dehydrogenase involved in D-alanine esterification of teichoic acids